MERLINKLLELRLLRSFKVKTTPRWIILLLDMLIVLVSYASTVVADIYSTGTPGQSGTTLLVGLLVLLYYFIVTYISKSYTCVIRLSVIEDLYRIFMVVAISTVMLVLNAEGCMACCRGARHARRSR